MLYILPSSTQIPQNFPIVIVFFYLVFVWKNADLFLFSLLLIDRFKKKWYRILTCHHILYPTTTSKWEFISHNQTVGGWKIRNTYKGKPCIIYRLKWVGTYHVFFVEMEILTRDWWLDQNNERNGGKVERRVEEKTQRRRCFDLISWVSFSLRPRLQNRRLLLLSRCTHIYIYIYIFKCFYMFYSFLLIHHVYIFITLWWAEVLVRRTLERWGLHDVPMFYLFICFPLQVWTLSLLFWHGWSGLSSGFCFWWIIDLKSLCCILIYTAH